MTLELLFASIDLDYAPLEFAKFSKYLRTFVQDGGGFSLLGLSIWMAVRGWRSMAPAGANAVRTTIPVGIAGITLLALVFVAAGAAGAIFGSTSSVKSPLNPFEHLENPPGAGRWWDWCFSIAGALALIGVFVPFVKDLMKLRLGRIWALTRLSFLESIRKRILWVFLIFLIPFLFPAKWFFPLKPEAELSTNIDFIYWVMTPFLMLAAGILASFSLPTDIRTQTIHTIVTKPVERFEILIGRFLGYQGLITLVLLAVSGFSWLMIIASRVDPESREESMKARDPVYGELGFMGPPGSRFSGESVGREYERRRYIPGGPNNPFRAIWYFYEKDLRSDLQKMPDDAVKCEFNFDIFRTTKGEENKGVFCSFFFATYEANKDIAGVRETYLKRIREEKIIPTACPDGSDAERAHWPRLVKLAEELGYFEFSGKEVFDYHTLFVHVPAGIFRKAMQGKPDELNHQERGKIDGPRLYVAVRCDSRTQLLGVKPNDLYFLASEGNFHLNYFKGMAGLWLRLCLVVGIAVTCSTYLNGVVSFLSTLFLVGLGFFRGFIISLALIPFSTDVANPGPTDSLRKLITNESLGTSPENSPAQQVTVAMDEGFRWCLRRLLNVIPNMERLSWTDYVASGFNVPIEDICLNGLMVGAYLILWALLGHYLIKWREIATW
jgi:ABC-type transport system involved in multi-copper enzyme maturation permease subunit